jgi:hypothetical protein
MPGGSETVQLTGPPEAVSVIVPELGGETSSVAGLTVRVPAVVALALADADAEAAVGSEVLVPTGLAPGVPAPGVPAPGVPAPGVPAPGMPAPGVMPALAVATTLARGAPAPGMRAAAGPVPTAAGMVPLAEGPAPAWCPPGWGWGGTTAMVTPAAMAAAVPAAVL